MAKRKRLTPAVGISGRELGSEPPELETKSGYPFGVAPKSRAPIAQVAGEAAAQSALEALADEMGRARKDGLLVQRIALDDIAEDHLVRDRMTSDAAEMESLQNSIRTRGQQTPIEVVQLEAGRFGLISGWRRVQAMRALLAETGAAQFAQIAALVKPIDTVSDSYVAMVEENEIRANLSFYERAHLACEAARLGVYATPAQAVGTLFANATAARRSKINSFVRLHEAMGASLRFPAAIPEKLGLALVGAVEKDKAFAARLRDMLRKTPPQSAEEERSALERALSKSKSAKAPAAPKGEEVAPGLRLEASRGRLVLSGAAVTEGLRADLAQWLARR